MKPAAQERLRRGFVFYEHKRYAEAIAEFQAGLTIERRGDFYYALGQAERMRGNCPQAIEHYRAFLNTPEATPARTAAVLGQIERCRADPPVSPGVAPPPSPPPPPDASPPRAVSEVSATVVASPAPTPAGARSSILHLVGLAGGDLVAQRGGGEVGLTLTLLPNLDAGGMVAIGADIGARLTITLHADGSSSGRLGPLVQVRGVVHPVAAGTALGGGALVGATLAAGPGRLVLAAGGELYDGPPTHRPYAILLLSGYELDLWPHGGR
jgi:hypothetical protein